MMDRSVPKGFEVVAGSEEALGDRGGAEDDTVDGVIQGDPLPCL